MISSLMIVQEYYYDDKLKFVCVVIIRLEPSNYLSGILFCFLVYALYGLVTMYIYVYVSTWVYGLLDFE